MGKCAQCGDESIETEPICKPCKKPRVGFNGKNERSKYTISVDMDGVLCDFHKKYLALKSLDLEFPQSLQGFFLDLEPMPGAIEGFQIPLEQVRYVCFDTSLSLECPLLYRKSYLGT
jgi:hypothetical protein